AAALQRFQPGAAQGFGFVLRARPGRGRVRSLLRALDRPRAARRRGGGHLSIIARRAGAPAYRFLLREGVRSQPDQKARRRIDGAWPLMWEAITEQIRKHNVRYLFGCGSLYTTDPAEVSAMFSLLKSKYYAPDAFRVAPVAKCAFHGVAGDAPIADEQAVFQKLPSLIKGYLRIGA